MPFWQVVYFIVAFDLNSNSIPRHDGGFNGSLWGENGGRLTDNGDVFINDSNGLTGWLSGFISAINNAISTEPWGTFCFRGATNNADWALSNGVYTTGTETISVNGYGFLFSLGNSNTFTGYSWFFQIWFSTDGFIQYRRSINSTDGNEWTAWETIQKS